MVYGNPWLTVCCCAFAMCAARNREGVPFEDDRFRPRPSSLDGRPGKGSAAAQDDEGGDTEKRGRGDAEVREKFRRLFGVIRCGE